MKTVEHWDDLNGCPEALEGGGFEDVMLLEDMNPAQVQCLQIQSKSDKILNLG